ncbi:reverse transcriptase-like protein [bacterium D16-51]|nr:reverse transcriptase-like protein [bacterium D16-59]RKI57333.1 reverse transcriptase-like protein [bacterium D16-51]
MGKKVYAVRNGRKTGIFDTWAECQKQTTGFSGAEFKSFTTRAGAEAYLAGEDDEAPFTDRQSTAPLAGDGTMTAYVDGSFDKLSGDFSCGMVVLYQGQEKLFCHRFCDRELAQMHNVAGEIKGAEAAMRFAVAKQIKRLVIYHDYEGIAKWCNGAWKANKEGTKAYQAYYNSIRGMLNIEFVKVKGHSNDHYNDMADALAKQALGLGDTDYATEDFQGLYA